MCDMVKNTPISPSHNKLMFELRRGVLVLATLSQLDEAKYGYSLIQELGARGLDIEQGTLYPLLRRLEEQGLLLSEWNVEGSRPRRYYRLSSAGADVVRSLSTEWYELVSVMNELLNPAITESKDESH